MSASTIAYFGYGSLVNLQSLRTPYISAHKATVKGWKRTWLSRPYEPGSFAAAEGLAFLSVTPAVDAEIDGMMITDHASSLPSLDKRESLYSRFMLDNASIAFHDLTNDQKSDPKNSQNQQQTAEHSNKSNKHFLYVADNHPADKNSRILRSYLDVVMQGYHKHFGIAGLEKFFATTLNFDLGIKEDRDTPLYPRAVELTPEEKEIFAKFR